MSISLLCYILIGGLGVSYGYNNVVIGTIKTPGGPSFDSFGCDNSNLYSYPATTGCASAGLGIYYNNYLMAFTNSLWGNTYDFDFVSKGHSFLNEWFSNNTLTLYFTQIQVNGNFSEIIDKSNNYWKIRGGTYKYIWKYRYDGGNKWNNQYALSGVLYQAGGTGTQSIPISTLGAVDATLFTQGVNFGEINVISDNILKNVRFKEADLTPVVITGYNMYYNTGNNTLIFKELNNGSLEFKYFNCIKFYVPDYSKCNVINGGLINKNEYKAVFSSGFRFGFIPLIGINQSGSNINLTFANYKTLSEFSINNISGSLSSTQSFLENTDNGFGIYTGNDGIGITSTNNTISSIFNCDIDGDGDVSYLTEAPLCPITILGNGINIISNGFDNISNSFEIIMSIGKDVNNNQTLLTGNNAGQGLVIPFGGYNQTLDNRFLFLKRFIYLIMFVFVVYILFII